MAPKAAKRSSASVSESRLVSGPKRRKVIGDAIASVDHLSEQCREMLCAIIPGSLGVKPEQRHALQSSAVDILAQALDTHESVLEDKSKKLTLETAAVVEEAVFCAAVTAKLEQALSTKSSEVLSKKEAMVEDHCAVTACSAQLNEAKAAQTGLAAELKQDEKERKSFEELIAEHLVPLKDAPPTLKRELKKHLAALEEAMKPLGCDEALVVAIPSSFPKLPEQRGAFDQLVVDHISELLAREVATRSEKLSRSAETMAERAAAVQAAEEALEAAKVRLDASSASLTTSEHEKNDLEAQLKDTKSKGHALARKVEEVAAASDEHEEARNAFKEVLAVFATERDGEAAKVGPELAKVSAPPAVDQASLVAAGA